jgi:hypothetical protein
MPQTPHCRFGRLATSSGADEVTGHLNVVTCVERPGNGSAQRTTAREGHPAVAVKGTGTDEVPPGRRAQVERLVRAIRDGDIATVDEAVLRLSRSRRSR